MVLPALNLASRSQSGLLSSSCVIREYFWDWQLQAPLPLRPKPGGRLGTWRLEVGGRRGKWPRLWEGAGKRGSPEQEARQRAGEAAGPLAAKANRKDCPPSSRLGARESPPPPSRSSGPRVRRRAGRGRLGGELRGSSPPPAPDAPPSRAPLAAPRPLPNPRPPRARRPPFPRAAAGRPPR